MPPRIVKEVAVRRSEIIGVATELFATRGYTSTTIADILDAAGIAKGGFYHHFASKDEVFVACVDRIAADLADQFVTALQDASLRPRERVLAYVRLGYTGGAADRSGIVHELHVHGGHELHARVIDGVQARVLPAFAQAIAQGRDDGDYDFDGDPIVMSVAVVGMLRALHERYAHAPDATALVPQELVVPLVERMLGVEAAIGRSTP
jgi:AcrR family transcriptional regulator